MDQERLAWSLTLALIGLSALFIVLSATAPDLMARPLRAGGIFSVGMAFGLAIIAVAVAAAAFFEHHLNRSAQSPGARE
jgi:uncharacterized membrane protein (DUF485 family)